jgi:hypothetical protein
MRSVYKGPGKGTPVDFNDYLPPLRVLADRIRRRAAQGLTVHLTPETAKQISTALGTVADGPLTVWEITNDYTSQVLDYSRPGCPEVLAYTRHSGLARAAYEEACRVYPGRRLMVTGGGRMLAKTWEGP